MMKRRLRVDPFLQDKNLEIDHKDPNLLRRFITDSGKIIPRRITGLNAKHQRQIAKAIKRARNIGLLPFCAKHGSY
ncbi:MAG: 30S ribosomal protein S18 [Myxococcales bacterium]|nr:30S ribosomal protein S18 [Myxococcales bacterium]